jgi:hypothetical protein
MNVALSHREDGRFSGVPNFGRVLGAASMPESFLREINDGKRVMYPALGESVPRGENRLLENAGHTTIHTDRPDAVVGAIRDLLDRVDR